MKIKSATLSAIIGRRSRVVVLAMIMCGASAALGAPVPAPEQASRTPGADVQSTLARYKSAIEHLDGRRAADCFAPDAEIFESGGAEGSYAQYLEHHLGPELATFRSFSFSNYAVKVRLEGTIALASETYTYKIVTKTGEPVERQGVATSVLRKTGTRWLIISLHSSGRKPKNG